MQSLDRRDESGEWNDAFERRLDDALTAAPEVSVSPEFARRVSARVAARPTVQVHSYGYGRRSILIGAVGLLLALLLLAPHAVRGATLVSALEWIFCAQLSLLALFSVSPWSPWRLRG